MIEGERQVAPTLEGIRRDHVARYEWAAKKLEGKGRVIDLACGVGYGTSILAAAGCQAFGFDRDAEAIQYARTHYARPGAIFTVADAGTVAAGEADAAICFETIEHIEDPAPMLRNLRGIAPRLIASVPNEDVFPHNGGILFHYRHYTRGQFKALLNRCGWRVVEWWGQAGQEAEVELDLNGWTLIAVCERGELPVDDSLAMLPTPDELPVPGHVSILGLGPSLEQYVDLTKRLGGKHAYCDETWGINAVGGVIMCDRLFHMDDVRIQELRAKALPESNIARMLEWLKVHPGPIVTSRAHPDYPGLVEFPLQNVVNKFRHAYFNSTASYAVAYAAYIGVKTISLFGCDFTYPNAHQAEKGRACVEFWLGVAVANGIEVKMPKTTSLMDALHTQAERLYGYDTVDVAILNDGGKARVEITERARLPTAEEIEARYDHSRHPSPLVASN